MYYWWKAYGFKPVAYSGLETGNRAFASYVLESGQARFVVSAAYSPTHEIAAHHMVHGDGVKVIALEVEDVEKAWRETTARGGKSAWTPREEKDDFGIFRLCGAVSRSLKQSDDQCDHHRRDTRQHQKQRSFDHDAHARSPLSARPSLESVISSVSLRYDIWSRPSTAI